MQGICQTTVYLILLTLIGSWRSFGAYDCSISSLSNCLSAFVHEKIDISHLDDDVPYWDESLSKLKIRCESYKYYSDCMEFVTPRCNISIQLALQGLENAYRFLCANKTSQEDYYKNQFCYGTPDVREATATCNRTLNAKLSLKAKGNFGVQVYCRYADEYIDCLSDGISSYCTEVAASWQKAWLRRLREPAMRYYECPGWVTDNGSSDTWTTALTVALAFTTTLMVIGIITFTVLIIKRRADQMRQLRRAQNNPMDTESPPLPPPYSLVRETQGPDGQLQSHLVDALSSPAASEAELDSTAHTLSYPNKMPILPPPYCERPEAPAPPYDATGGVAVGAINDAFKEEEEEEEQRPAGEDGCEQITCKRNEHDVNQLTGGATTSEA